MTRVQNALIEMFANASPEEIERVPALWANIVTLGATPEVVTRLRDVLIGLVSSTSGIDKGSAGFRHYATRTGVRFP